MEIKQSCSTTADVWISKNNGIAARATFQARKSHRWLRLRGGMPNVGMENWTSDWDRECWNESNPNITSPLFVPKGNWTEEDFEKARNDPRHQNELCQYMIKREYERLNGIPHSYDPNKEDPWFGVRGEGGPEVFGDDPFSGLPGRSNQSLREDPKYRKYLQGLAWHANNTVDEFRAIELMTALATLQELQIYDFEKPVKELFPLRDDEYKGPQFRSQEQREAAAALLYKAITTFLGPEYPPLEIDFMEQCIEDTFDDSQ